MQEILIVSVYTKALPIPVSWLLPGGSPKSNQYCGQPNGKFDQCPTKLDGHLFNPFHFSCGRVICSACFEDVISEKSYFGYNRVLDVLELLISRGYQLSLGEMVVSPPPRLWEKIHTKEGFNALRSYAWKEIALPAGIIGAAVFMHPYRRNAEYREKVRRREIIGVYEPHFHYFAISLLDGQYEKSSDTNLRTSLDPDDPGKANRKTGWAYKWLNLITKNGNMRDLYTKFRYEMDHAGVYTSDDQRFSQIVTWNGILSRRAIEQIKTKSVEDVICQVCGEQADRYAMDGQYCEGPAERTITNIDHKLRAGQLARLKVEYDLTPGPAWTGDQVSIEAALKKKGMLADEEVTP